MRIKFSEAFHPEFEGYIWESDSGVYISFISSKQEGQGNFVKLLEEFKQKYDFIKIPTPSMRMVGIALKRGFVPEQEWFKEAKEMCDVLVWRKRVSSGEGEKRNGLV